MLRLLLVRAGLPEPEVNGEIRDARGVFVAFGDLLFRAYRVLVEYDGGGHRTDERQFHRDVARLDDVMELGIRVIRVNKSLMNQPKLLIAKVARALTRSVPSRE
jgi:very-short-patch-repair endonuclease